MAPLLSFLIQELNSHYRPDGATCPFVFPAHEFDAAEAAKLAKFCDRIGIEGYDFIYNGRKQTEIQDILDLAAEYGHFTDEMIGAWYLGVFLIAEAVMEPYASDSFSIPMLKSAVFQACPAAIKQQGIFLMLIAIFCDRSQTAGTRVQEFMTESAAQKYPISEIELRQVLSQLSQSGISS